MISESSQDGRIIFQDLTYLGMRLSIGMVFLMAGYFNLANPDFLKQMVPMGLPIEFTTMVSLGEFLAGIFLMIGILTRISSIVTSLLMLGIIFHIKWSVGYFGPNGWEFDVVFLSVLLTFIVFGPKRISLTHLLKRIPKFLQ